MQQNNSALIASIVVFLNLITSPLYCSHVTIATQAQKMHPPITITWAQSIHLSAPEKKLFLWWLAHAYSTDSHNSTKKLKEQPDLHERFANLFKELSASSSDIYHATATMQNETVGFILFQKTATEGEVAINYLITHRGYRNNKAIGTKLLLRIKEKLPDTTKFIIDTQTVASKVRMFYQSIGFIKKSSNQASERFEALLRDDIASILQNSSIQAQEMRIIDAADIWMQENTQLSDEDIYNIIHITVGKAMTQIHTDPTLNHFERRYIAQSLKDIFLNLYTINFFEKYFNVPQQKDSKSIQALPKGCRLPQGQIS